MTELEKMQHAKMYIDKLANGINPIDDTMIPEDDTLNNVRLSRCLFYVSDILRQVIQNGGNINSDKKAQKIPFYLTLEQRSQYVPANTPISVSEITRSLNSLVDLNRYKKLNYSKITDWLIRLGALEIQTDFAGKSKKVPTTRGAELGINVEKRSGMTGEYDVVVYNRDAQQFIVDNIDAIILQN
ncbi:MAG: hypothetical protein MJ132_02920 [Clostridia bacterium]|nr:hypothetical protein [Clostridia bacterium]